MPKPKPRAGEEVTFRHALATRITHWLNVAAFTLLLMSGLQILIAHPRLYWGQYGANFDRPAIAFISEPDGRGGQRGVTHIGPLTLETTGFLGVSKENGVATVRGVPAWMTLPSFRDLAAGRRWHFFIAWIFVINGLVYLFLGFSSRHIQRDLAPRPDELKPKHLLKEIVHHAQLKVPRGEASKRYNTLQKLAYLSVIFVLLPLMVLTGLTMSPGFNAFAPIFLDVFGGRQSARTLHFITAMLLIAFVCVHLFEIFLVGVWNEVRSMITGWYVVKPEKTK